MRGRRTALVLVDFINPFHFSGAARLVPRALAAARRTAALKARSRRSGIRTIYVNDNFGDWTSEFQALVEKCAALPGPAGEVTRLLKPAKGDLSILKPRHSGFYGSPLEFLLDELRVGKLVICGIAADMCVYATVQDAHMRGYRVRVPSDCVASASAAHERQALDQMARTMSADTRASRATRSG
jgi:nicotinamidase-related amidase